MAAEGNFVIPKMRTETGNIVSGVKLRNEIPDSVKRSQSTESFKEKCKKIFCGVNTCFFSLLDLFFFD